MRRITALLLALLVLMPAMGQASGSQGTSNYTYSYWSEEVPVPPAYTLSASLTANLFPEIDSLAGLIDAYVTEDTVYILCSNQLIIMDYDFKVQKVIAEFENGEGTEALDGNGGIFVTTQGDYYITQPDKSRILHFEADGALRRVLGRPEITGFETVSYRPTKLVVDSAERIFVIAKGMYEGIVELRPDGTFSRFYGVNGVEYNFIDLIWRTIATAEQRARMPLWLPSDFTSLALDDGGFIFATVQAQDGQKAVLRLNAKGENILKMPKDLTYPMGDESWMLTGAGIPTGGSNLIMVDTSPYGMFLTLDAKRARVFAYNEDGMLLFVFGGLGDRQGYFRNPIATKFVGNNIIVLDQLAQSIEVFAPTEYGKALLTAVYYQHHYDYENASLYWREALTYNANLTLAYSGIGRALIREKKYEEALEYLEHGNDRKYYSKAYEKVRNETLREWFVPGVSAIAVLIVAVVIINAVRKRRKGDAREVTA